MARALPRRAKVSVRDRLRLPDGLRAFAQGSYLVSLRWRGGCPCGHQFYMPPAGGENHITGLRPMENKPTAPGAFPSRRRRGFTVFPPQADLYTHRREAAIPHTTLGPKGPVKSENPPANGRSNPRTFSIGPFFKIPLLLKAKSFIITMIYYCFAICGTGTKEILEV